MKGEAELVNWELEAAAMDAAEIYAWTSVSCYNL